VPWEGCQKNIGDFNAKIGREDIYRPTIVKYSVHTKSNDSGIRLINFAFSRNIVIGSSLPYLIIMTSIKGHGNLMMEILSIKFTIL
jgi:hypothetical protein